MDRQYIVSGQALTLIILESALDFLESGRHILTEGVGGLDEGKLQDIQDRVRAAIDLMKNHPEEYGMKIDELLKSGYGKTLNAIKGVLAKYGITATRNNPLTGLPSVKRTSLYNRELDRDSTLKGIQKLVQSRTHQFDGVFRDNQKHAKLFVPTERDERYGYLCSVVGNLADNIEELDGDGLTVTLTGQDTYGFDDGQFCEKTYFITLDPESRKTA